MGRKEKLLEKAFNNPAGLSFRDFEALLKLSDWTFDRQRGSHRVWISPHRYRLPIQVAKNGKAKGYQVTQFLKQYEEESKAHI